MVSARHVFRFTIGQGMAAIAAFALALAFLPMSVAIILAIATLLVVFRSRLGHPRVSVADPARGERIGCLSCSLGLFVGSTLGVIVVANYSETASDDEGLWIIVAALVCGFAGAVVGGIIGRRLARAFPGQPLSPPDSSAVQRQAVQAEIEYLERLLGQADLERDEEVRMKLSAYKARLEHELVSGLLHFRREGEAPTEPR